MISRNAAMHAARRAAEVLDEERAAERVAQGYTRIDPIGLCEKAGVSVLARPLDRLLGAFLRLERPGILLNSQRPVGMLHMTCAHELGHFYLGHLTTTDETIDYREEAATTELEADQFAYALMAPAWLLAHLSKARRWDRHALSSPITVYQLSLRMGLSYTATIWSLERRRWLSAQSVGNLLRYTPAEIRKQLNGDRATKKNSDIWLLRPEDRDCILEPRPADQFLVDVPNHLSAGYLWSVDEAQASGFNLEPLTTSEGSPSLQTDASTATPQESRYLLEINPDVAASEKPATVRFSERQPWVSAEGIDAFSLVTQFEQLGLGLTPGSRRQLLDGAE